MVRRAQILVHALSALKAEELAARMDLWFRQLSGQAVP